MVISRHYRRVEKFLVCMATLWVTNSVHAAALTISADEARIEYGKPAWLTIETRQRNFALETLDFSRWDDDVVVQHEREVETDAAGVQRWRVRAYPRRIGPLTLSPLVLGSAQSTPLELASVLPVDPRHGAPFNIACRISTDTPYLQQQVLAGCALDLPDERVLFEYPRQTPRGVQLVPLQRVSTIGASPEKHHAGWLVIPQQTGQHVYELPPLQLVRDGVITHRFYLPRLHLDVQPLPLYLPGTIPVARVRVTRYALDSWLLAPTRLANVHLQAQVQGVTAESLPDYAQAVRSDATLQTYAATVQHTQHVDEQGVHHTLDYAIPVTPQRQGWYRLPDLRVQYFDAHSGTLHAYSVPGPRVLILAGWMRLLIALGVLGLVWYAGCSVYRLATRVRWRWQHYRAAQAVLEGAATHAQMYRAMQLMAQAEGWTPNLTYRQWSEKMQRNGSAALPYQLLYETAYAGATRDLRTVRDSLLQLCRQRRFKLRSAGV